MSYPILLLIYANDIVFFALDEAKMRRLLDGLQTFCVKYDIIVNVGKIG